MKDFGENGPGSPAMGDTLLSASQKETFCVYKNVWFFLGLGCQVLCVKAVGVCEDVFV